MPFWSHLCPSPHQALPVPRISSTRILCRPCGGMRWYIAKNLIEYVHGRNSAPGNLKIPGLFLGSGPGPAMQSVHQRHAFPAMVKGILVPEELGKCLHSEPPCNLNRKFIHFAIQQIPRNCLLASTAGIKDANKGSCGLLTTGRFQIVSFIYFPGNYRAF